MIKSYRNTTCTARFVVGLIGYAFSGFASIPEAAAQSPTEMMQDMMNMTGIGLDTSLPKYLSSFPCNGNLVIPSTNSDI
jgi:hypothetical protein